MQWQPIATVPQDNVPYVTCGTLVLVADTDGNFNLMYGFAAAKAEYTAADGTKRGYTHWMPLPDPPSAEESK